MSTFRTEMDVSTGVATAVPQRVYSSGAYTLVLDDGAAAPAGYVEVIGPYTPPPSRGQIAARRYEPPGFGLRLGAKDVRLALQAGEAAGVPMPFASVLRDGLIEAASHGDGGKDLSALAEVSRRRGGRR